MADGDNIPRWLTERGRRHGRMWVREFLNVGTPVPSGSGGPAPWAVPAHPGLGVWHPPSSCPGGPGHPLLGLALICYQFCCLVSEGQRFPAWGAHTASGKRLLVQSWHGRQNLLLSALFVLESERRKQNETKPHRGGQAAEMGCPATTRDSTGTLTVGSKAPRTKQPPAWTPPGPLTPSLAISPCF